MIGKLTGLVDNVDAGLVVIDVGGVGYVVACSMRTAQDLVPGQRVALLVETMVREDAISLYGFVDAAEREMFRLLLTVQGVGGKAALSVLGVLDPDALVHAILAADKSSIGRAAGIGPKLAARIVAELKDRIAAAMPAGRMAAAPALARPGSGAAADAVSALVNLGFGASEAFGAVERALSGGDALPAEALIRAALHDLAPHEPGR